MSTTPLPPDAAEFNKMPKASCKTCNATMPLQMLALHVQECELEGVSLISLEQFPHFYIWCAITAQFEQLYVCVRVCVIIQEPEDASEQEPWNVEKFDNATDSDGVEVVEDQSGVYFFVLCFSRKLTQFAAFYVLCCRYL